MPEIVDQTYTLVLAATIFILVLSVWVVLILALGMRRAMRIRQMDRRLDLIGDDDDASQSRVLRLWHDGAEATTVVANADGRTPLSVRLRRLPADLGWDTPIQSVLLALIGAMIMAGVLAFTLTASVLTAVSVATVVLVAFYIFVQHRLAKRAAHFERQLVDALKLVARSLRAGHPLQGAFQLVAQEMDDPISSVFADVYQQQSLGMSMEESLRRTATMSRSEDLKLFATSVAIQLRSGGNLADMMEQLAQVISERIRLGRRMKVLTTQTQFSKRVLLVLPVAMFAVLSLIRPDYMAAMYTTDLGRLMLAAAIASLCMGSWLMNRMARIRY